MYCVLRRDSLEQLEEKVNEYIADGWQPLGGRGSPVFTRLGFPQLLPSDDRGES